MEFASRSPNVSTGDSLLPVNPAAAAVFILIRLAVDCIRNACPHFLPQFIYGPISSSRAETSPPGTAISAPQAAVRSSERLSSREDAVPIRNMVIASNPRDIAIRPTELRRSVSIRMPWMQQAFAAARTPENSPGSTRYGKRDPSLALIAGEPSEDSAKSMNMPLPRESVW